MVVSIARRKLFSWQQTFAEMKEDGNCTGEKWNGIEFCTKTI